MRFNRGDGNIQEDIISAIVAKGQRIKGLKSAGDSVRRLKYLGVIDSEQERKIENNIDEKEKDSLVKLSKLCQDYLDNGPTTYVPHDR